MIWPGEQKSARICADEGSFEFQYPLLFAKKAGFGMTKDYNTRNQPRFSLIFLTAQS